jgi:photosystem II stability/assembly factor-like uncharacterized protein
MYLVNNSWGTGFNYYKSSDGGKQWEKFFTPELDSLYSSYCQAFILNPVDSSDMWCHNYEGSDLYRSTNSGINWTQLSEPELHPSILYANDGKTIYISNPSMKRSTDNGKTWTSLSPKPSLKPVVIDPKNADIIYTVELVEGSSSVYKSEDGGINWIKQIGAVSNVFNLHLFISDSQSGKLIFIDGNTINLTVDGGRSWKILSGPPIQGSPALGGGGIGESVAFNPNNPDGLFFLTYKGLFETKNLGKSWALVKEHEPDMSLNVVSGEVYLSTSTNVYKLKSPQFSSETTNCLFDWAEQQYPDTFSPATAQSQFVGEYIYRYYSDTNTYLGFFQHKKVHLLQPTISDKIKDVGFIQHYLNLSLCDEK